MSIILMMCTNLHPSSRLVMAWHCHWLNTFMAVEMRECFYRTSLISLVHYTSSLVTLTPSWIYNGVSLIKVMYVLCINAAQLWRGLGVHSERCFKLYDGHKLQGTQHCMVEVYLWNHFVNKNWNYPKKFHLLLSLLQLLSSAHCSLQCDAVL